MSENSNLNLLKEKITHLLSPYANEMEDERLGVFLSLSLGRVLINSYRNNPEDININKNQLRHITDWLKAAIINNADWISNLDELNRPKKLMKFSTVESIIQEADKVMLISAQKLAGVKIVEGDEELVTSLEDGYYIVKLLTPKALDRESGHMQHCIGDGGYDENLQYEEFEYLSLRDPVGKPHITLEIENNEINQIQGKQNDCPVQKYMDILIPFLNEKQYGLTCINLSDYGCVLDANKNWFHHNSFKEGQIFDGTLDLVAEEDLKPLPNNFHVKGSLYLSQSNLKKLPKGLIVDGNLDISYTAISTVPSGLIVKGDFDLIQSNIRSLPKKIEIGGCLLWEEAFIKELPKNIGSSISLSASTIDKFPEEFHVKGDLDLQSAQVDKLSDILIVDGTLRLDGSEVKELPRTLKVGGNLYCSSTEIKCFPDNMSVEGIVEAQASSIQSLGNNRKFKNDLILINCDIQELPDNLKVRGSLDIKDTEIETLPKGLQVKKEINIIGTQIEALPSDIKVKEIIMRPFQIGLDGIPEGINLDIMLSLEANKYSNRKIKLGQYKEELEHINGMKYYEK